MATLPSLRPNGTISTVNVSLVNGPDAHTILSDFDPSTVDAADTSYIFDSGTVNADCSLNLTDTPTDFGAMESPLTVRAVTQSVNWVDDTDTLSVQIFAADGTTPYTNQVTLATEANATKAVRTASLTVNAAGLAASKADWNAARLRMLWTYAAFMSKDNVQIRVWSLEVDGTYTVGGTPVSDSVQARWDVTGPVSDSVQARWAVAEPAVGWGAVYWAEFKAPLASGLTAVSDSIQTRWGTGGAVSDTTQTQWATHALASDTTATRWDVRSTVVDTASAAWTVAATTADTTQVRWDAHAAIGDAQTINWSVAAAIAEAVAARWDTHTAATDSVQTRWAVEQTGAVTDTTQTGWAVAATVVDSVQARWDTLTAVTDTTATRWNVDAQVVDSVQARWAVAADVGWGAVYWAQFQAPATGTTPVSDSMSVRWAVIHDPYAAEVLPDGPAGYWPLADDATDHSGNNHDATNVNAVAFDGTHATFDGTNYLTANTVTAALFDVADPPNSDITLEAWVTPTAAAAGCVIGGNAPDPSTTNRYQFSLLADGTFEIENQADVDISAGAWTAAQEHHVALAVRGNNGEPVYQFYVDGVLVSASSGEDTLPVTLIFQDAADRFSIGQEWDGATVSDLLSSGVKVRRAAAYPSVLSQERVQTHTLAGGGTIPVAASVSARWQVHTTEVAASVSARWTVQSIGIFDPAIFDPAIFDTGDVVSTSTAARWTVHTAVADVVAGRWATDAQTADVAAARWATAATVADAAAARWTTLSDIADAAAIRWGVAGATVDTAAARWTTNAETVDTVSVRFGVLEQTADAAAMRWAVLAVAADTVEGRWGVGGPASDTVAVRWLVHPFQLQAIRVALDGPAVRSITSTGPATRRAIMGAATSRTMTGAATSRTVDGAAADQPVLDGAAANSPTADGPETSRTITGVGV